jgi:hypothetical protein
VVVDESYGVKSKVPDDASCYCTGGQEISRTGRWQFFHKLLAPLCEPNFSMQLFVTVFSSISACKKAHCP